MGTNYYIEEQPPCEHCGRPYDKKHIGKSSAGWYFSLRIYPNEGINNLEDWIKYWNDKQITDEYGASITQDDMMKIITERRCDERWNEAPWNYSSWAEFHALNESEQGDNGLLRHHLNDFCVGHGEGTYDYFKREFS